MLDELLATGEVTWSGAGSISGSDGWIALHAGESAPLTLGGPADIELGDAHRAILDTLAGAAPTSSANSRTAECPTPRSKPRCGN